MRVSLADVQSVFDGLLAGQSRELASAWAFERMQTADAGNLTYDPPDEADRIWEALTFLCGVDTITDMAGRYVYGRADIERYRP